MYQKRVAILASLLCKDVEHLLLNSEETKFLQFARNGNPLCRPYGNLRLTARSFFLEIPELFQTLRSESWQKGYGYNKVQKSRDFQKERT